MTLLLATNHPRQVASAMVGSGLVTGCLTVTLAPLVGIKGAAPACLIGDLCLVAWYLPYRAIRVTGSLSPRLLARVTVIPLLPVCVSSLVAMGGWIVLASRWLGMLCCYRRH